MTITDLRYRTTASAVLRMLGSKGNGSEGQNKEAEDVLATQAYAKRSL